MFQRSVLAAFCFSALVALPLLAQSRDTATRSDFVHEFWTVEHGLPVNAIQRLTVGREGYLWLATWDGLVRFDGARFTVFNSGNTDALPSSRFIDMIPSTDGSLWLRTEQEHLIRVRDGQFTHFGESRGLRNRGIRSVSVDAAGGVVVATAAGVHQLVGERFEPVAPLAIGGEVTAATLGRDGRVWAASRHNGLHVVSGRNVTRIVFPDNAPLTVSVVRADRENGVWIGTSQGLYHTRRDTAHPVVLTSGRVLQQSISDIRLSAAGEVWVASSNGVFVVRNNTLKSVRETPERVTEPGIRFHPDGSVWYAVGDELYRDGQFVFQIPRRSTADARVVKQIQDFGWDAEGSLWIGTYDSGLHRLKQSVFRVYSAPEGVANRNVTSVMQDRQGALWIGTFGGGLSRLRGDSVASFTPARGYPPFVLSLLHAADGTLWVGTLQEGVRQCQLAEMRCAAPPGEALPSGATVRAMHQSAAGDVWLGTDEGLFRQTGSQWQRIDIDGNAANGPVRAFLSAPDGTLFMATNGAGVLAFRNGRLHRITSADGLPSDLIRSLYLDARGSLWVGTEGRGIARVRTRITDRGELIATEVRTIRKRDGLFDEVIHQILPDSFGRLWMGTNRGIFWISLTELDAFADGRATLVSSTYFTERDGLRNREANGGQSPAGVVARDGRLWFATQDGAVVVDPTRIRSNAVPPPVIVEQLTTNGRVLPASAEVALTANEREFEIDYTALSFLAPENVRFRYQLEGFNDEWIVAGNRRTAFYTNVPPGTYTFRVVASNNDGVWNENGASLTLRVAPHFFETPAAWLLLAIALGLLTVGAIRWRLQHLRTRERELTSLVSIRTAELERNQRELSVTNVRLADLNQARSRLFANLSHEFRTPLTLILSPLDALLDGRYGPLHAHARVQAELMQRNALRLLRLINRILDLSRAEEGGLILDARAQDLVSFTRAVVDGFSSLAVTRRITLQFESDEPELRVEFDAEQLEKVLLNLLSNAIKFTPDGGRVRVTMTSDDGDAVLRVSDTGVGVAPDELPRLFERFYQGKTAPFAGHAGSGIGLSLTRELVALHGGTITASSTRGVGSVFVVRLPRSGPVGAVASDSTIDLTGGTTNGTVFAATDDPERGEDRTTILIVDDSADMRLHIFAILSPRYRVLEASNGREALSLCSSQLPDLIVADVMMPELDGLALSRALKADPMTESIPLVLLSARAAVPDQIAGLETGADAYLTKPFNAGVLEASVRNLLEQRKRLRDRLQADDLAPPLSEAQGLNALDERLRAIIRASIHDSDFGAEQLAAAADFSYHQLYRRLRDELGSTPSRYIRGVRVEYAADLLGRQEGTVSQIAFAVGFESLSYFRRAFRERFGMSPSDYIDLARSEKITPM